MKVAITGATGFVGTRLVERLQAEGHQILILTRSPAQAALLFPKSKFSNLQVESYNPQTTGDWQTKLAGWDGVVNLAGTPIAEQRWTATRKQDILDSRRVTTQRLVEAISQANPRPSVLVNASAIGYYGTSETARFDESSASGQDFLAQVCQSWEAEASKVKELGLRLVVLRLGIVLEKNGGALARMLPPFQLFAGGPIGSGRQWFSWIHREDVVNLILQALTDSKLEGVFNATAPNPVRMAELCNVLGQILHRPSWLPVPDLALELLLGDGAKVVLEGQQVLPQRTLAAGFSYQYPTVKQALEAILATR